MPEPAYIIDDQLHRTDAAAPNPLCRDLLRESDEPVKIPEASGFRIMKRVWLSAAGGSSSDSVLLPVA